MIAKTTFSSLALVTMVFIASCSSSTETAETETETEEVTASFEGYTFGDPSAAITFELMGVASDGTARAGADPAAMITPAGEVRLIFTGPNGNMASAVSSDGLTFTVDADFTSPFPLVGIGEQTIVASPTGGYRMFARSETEVFSATSDDGDTWTQESGTRFDVSTMGLDVTTGPSVVQLSNGNYRMYFSPEPTNCGQEGVSNDIYSASSVDQITWTADDGVRLGDDIESRCMNKPIAIAESDESVTLFYHVYSRIGSGDSYGALVYYANSSDGLTFTSQTATELGVVTTTSADLTLASDPYILEMPDGTVRLYFDALSGPEGDQIYVSSGARN